MAEARKDASPVTTKEVTGEGNSDVSAMATKSAEMPWPREQRQLRCLARDGQRQQRRFVVTQALQNEKKLYGFNSERNFRDSRKTITLRGGRVMVSSVLGLRPLREALS